jgi:hypothetical protein
MLTQLFTRDENKELHVERTYPAPIDAVWPACRAGMRNVRMILVVALFVAAAACGGSGDDEASAPEPVEEAGVEEGTTEDDRALADGPFTVDDYVEVLAEDSGGLTEVMSDDEAACFVGSMVEGIGLDRLEAAGMTPEAFAEADDFSGLVEEAEGRRITVDAMVDCTDFHDLVLSRPDVPAEHARCLREEVSERDLVEVLVGTTSGEDEPTPEAEAAYAAAVAACPEAMAAMAG